MTAPQPATPDPYPAPAPVAAGELTPPPDSLSAEEALVALLAAYVAAQTLQAGARASLTPARLVAAMMRFGIPRPVARATLRLALLAGVGVPDAPAGPGTAARRAIARAEPIWRARYLMAAAKRMTGAVLDPPRRPGQRAPAALPRARDLLLPGTSPGSLPGQQDTISPAQWTPQRMSPREAARYAFERERRYLEQHRQAQQRRLSAAAAVDAAAERWGPVLSWRAVRDARTTWDCLRMHGKNFRVDDPPAGRLPGTMHPRCRCTAGPPIPEARIVGASGI